MGKYNFGASWSCVTPALLVPQMKPQFFFYDITFVQELDTTFEVNKHMHVCVYTHHTYTHRQTLQHLPAV